ncbi:MAG: glycogen-binding domain-containing protein, partial [Treponema sp.]|nr:glycogen-binding domain-containing protein [Treponema sp.]
DSGILFYVEVIPDDMRNMDYRMIIDGLWTIDPLNPNGVTGSGGIYQSRVSLPARSSPPSTADSPAGQLRFSFPAATGEIVTVAGSFNNWDPFMYELRETSTGMYTLTLNLPPGTYQYVFFYRGERILDPYNSARVYTREGKIVSQVQVR